MKPRGWRLFSSGYWIVAFLVIVTLAVLLKRIIVPFGRGEFTPIIGDGRHVASYRFNLTPCLVSRQTLVASGNPKDALPALNDPALLTKAQATQLNAARRDSGGFIENASEVIGVTIHGQARAYPIAILNWHAVVNDTLGGVPIAVTYDGFCGSSVVYQRRVAGRKLRFGYSGLVYNSNTVLYDQEDSDANESLWSQIGGRAIAGPAAARRQTLTPLPCSVVTWGVWKRMYPQTTMIAGVPRLYAAYSRNPYATYYADPAYLRYPVAPLWHGRGFGFKSRIMLLWIQKRWHPLFFRRLFRQAAPDHLVHLRLAGARLVVQCWRQPQARTAALLWSRLMPTAYGLLFAWYAQHPRDFDPAPR